jgi:hypothetical protein
MAGKTGKKRGRSKPKLQTKTPPFSSLPNSVPPPPLVQIKVLRQLCAALPCSPGQALLRARQYVSPSTADTRSPGSRPSTMASAARLTEALIRRGGTRTPRSPGSLAAN